MEYPHLRSQNSLMFSHMEFDVSDLETMAKLSIQTISITQAEMGYAS